MNTFSNIIRFIIFFIVMGTINGIYWMYCKALGKKFTAIGGPQ